MSPNNPKWGNGHTNKQGYRVIKAHGHPMANTQGGALEHRVRLYDVLGPGDQPCHWCGLRLAWLSLDRRVKLCIDHLDNDKTNNDPTNLVPCCYACNTRRGSIEREHLRLPACRRGHPFTPENEYWYRGSRTCRRCKRDSLNRMRADRKALGIRRQHRGPDLWP